MGLCPRLREAMRTIKSALAVLSTFTLVCGLAACDEVPNEGDAFDDESALLETEGGANESDAFDDESALLETEGGANESWENPGDDDLGAMKRCFSGKTCKDLKAACLKAGGVFTQTWEPDGSTHGACYPD